MQTAIRHYPTATRREEQSPETLVLADHIDATSAQRSILATLGIRRNGAGALPALRTATRAIEAATLHHPSKRAHEWHLNLRQLVDLVASAAKEATWLETSCLMIQGRTVADALGSPVPSTLPAESRIRLDAWLGLHIFNALSREGVLSLSVLNDWDTLRRTGAPRSSTARAWISAAKWSRFQP